MSGKFVPAQGKFAEQCFDIAIFHGRFQWARGHHGEIAIGTNAFAKRNVYIDAEVERIHSSTVAVYRAGVNSGSVPAP
jgi:hypothetical protein